MRMCCMAIYAGLPTGKPLIYRGFQPHQEFPHTSHCSLRVTLNTPVASAVLKPRCAR